MQGLQIFSDYKKKIRRRLLQSPHQKSGMHGFTKKHTKGVKPLNIEWNMSGKTRFFRRKNIQKMFNEQ